MDILEFIKRQGLLNPDKNPEPVKFKGGFQVPHWEPLTYLEKLSLQIKEGQKLELADELIAIIKNVSENPRDNYRTWYFFIKILANLPNDKVTFEILDFLPTWFSGQFDTMLQTSEVCEKLLPKFLNDNSTADDIKKAEKILDFLFEVKDPQINRENIWDNTKLEHQSRIYLHFLSNTLKRQDILPKIAQYCSNELILRLARTIKKLLLEWPEGINSYVKDQDKTFEVKTLIDNKNLLVSVKDPDDERKATNSIILNFEELNEQELKTKIIEVLKNQNINYQPVENDYSEIFKRVNFAVNHDLTSASGLNSLSKLGDEYHHDEKLLNILSYILREILDQKAKQSPGETISLLSTLCFNTQYGIPFYKRMSIYVIAQNWETTKTLFWDLVKDKDYMHLFSKHQYFREIFELLDKNQQKLNDAEKLYLQQIIDQGKQAEISEVESLDYWKLGWYSALKGIEPFKSEYEQLSKALKIKYDHFANLGEVRMRSGSVPPFSKEVLLDKSNQEIAEYLINFTPKGNWEDASVSGLADIFGNAVEEDPAKFSTDLKLFIDVPYTYIYKMLYGFSGAWRKQKEFNWKNVLEFCLAYIKNEKFYQEGLMANWDDWPATSDWVVGTIAYLLGDGMQNDETSFDIELMPIAKEIIEILGKNLKIDKRQAKIKDDYPGYVVNSTAGKILRASFDYSLRYARNFPTNQDGNKWDADMKSIFEQAFQMGIIDGYILEGMYFAQFYYLDKDWIMEQVKSNITIEDQKWQAFIGGLAFGNAPFNKETYQVFYPHYEKAIKQGISLKRSYNQGLLRHLVAFYFWGFETIKSEKLVYLLINEGQTEHISTFINYVAQQEEYPKSLKEDEKKNFEQIIIELWSSVLNKFKKPKIDEERKLLGDLTRFIVFVGELNSTNSALIIESCSYLTDDYYVHGLLEDIATLKNKANHDISAKLVADIMTMITFRDYVTDSDQKNIIDLVQFMFEHNQKQAAISVCNKMALKQQLFLRDVYSKYAH